MNKRGLWLATAIFLVAVGVRLWVLFGVTDPQNAGVGWYTDTYHHWQIAYLSKEIGLEQGRLWDLKGMEYFWGIGQPALLIALFALTGSADILVLRLLTVVCGSLFAIFLYLLVRRYWGLRPALAMALLAVFSPVAIFTDISGLQPPLGWLALVLGFFFWPKQPVLTAFFWVLAGTFRAEFWLIGGVLTFLALLFEKNFDRRVVLLVSYLLLSAVHMKILYSATGNPIYPVYWNYRGNMAGEWVGKQPGEVVLSDFMKNVQLGCKLAFAVCTAGMLFLWRRKDLKQRLFFAWGLVNLGFLAGMAAFSDYAIMFEMPHFWYSQLFTWPYDFLALLIVLFFFVWLPKKWPFWTKLSGLNWLVVVLLLVGFSFNAWPVIMGRYRDYQIDWQNDVKAAQLIGSVYEQGKIIMPADRPDLVYATVKYGGVKGKDVVGDMYDPLNYAGKGASYVDGTLQEEFVEWLKKEKITTFVAYMAGKYEPIFSQRPGYLQLVGNSDYIKVFRVKL